MKAQFCQGTQNLQSLPESKQAQVFASGSAAKERPDDPLFSYSAQTVCVLADHYGSLAQPHVVGNAIANHFESRTSHAKAHPDQVSMGVVMFVDHQKLAFQVQVYKDRDFLAVEFVRSLGDGFVYMAQFRKAYDVLADQFSIQAMQALPPQRLCFPTLPLSVLVDEEAMIASVEAISSLLFSPAVHFQVEGLSALAGLAKHKEHLASVACFLVSIKNMVDMWLASESDEFIVPLASLFSDLITAYMEYQWDSMPEEWAVVVNDWVFALCNIVTRSGSSSSKTSEAGEGDVCDSDSGSGLRCFQLYDHLVLAERAAAGALARICQSSVIEGGLLPQQQLADEVRDCSWTDRFTQSDILDGVLSVSAF